MSKIVNDLFLDFFNQIPEGERNEKVLLEVFAQYVPQLAEKCGLCYMEAVILCDDRTNPCDRKKIILFDNGLQSEYGNKKENVYHMDNGGMVRLTAGIGDDWEWNPELEGDFRFLSKLLFIVYGRTVAMKQLFEVSYTDRLTGVANEAQLYRYMAGLLEVGAFGQYCSNFINIKNMKLFNEIYSDAQGNQILKSYATKIKDFVGKKGCACRLGGDNFLVLIETEREEDFLVFLKELCVEITLPGDRIEFIKIDSRLGYYPLKPGDGVSEAMNNSSIALNLAKKYQNADVILFQNDMKADMMKMRQLEESIPDAVENREFVVYYQPKVRMLEKDECVLCGGEALVRWIKDGHMISPGDFIPILEKNGIITEIDYYVFETVCNQIHKWETDGLTPVCISVNFSRRHLRDPRFADKVEEIVNVYQVNPAYLEIEITESYDAEDLEALTQFEERMHALGIRLAMDDFGSGFSSLKMLKDMTADIVKLDKSLVDGIGCEKKEDEIIVSYIIQMIHSLGKELIAEGVEKKEQAEFLKNSGCMMIQGFLYGRPVPEEEFLERIRQGR